MPPPIPRVTVIGTGAMGTLCALILAERGSRVTLWGRSSDRVAALHRDRRNDRYLPGHHFPESLTVTGNAHEAFSDPDLIVSAVPCQYIRNVWQRLAAATPRGVPVVSVAKGIEVETLLLPTAVISQELGDVPLACLSGPSIAPEIAKKKPATVVLASSDADVARRIQEGFSTEYFRVYSSKDLIGVEVAGGAKNVIALAAGICDGLECGENAKASLITRGLVEITRLGVALGARPETFAGLAGMGDLITTCASRVSRNRTAGERIGRGASADQVVADTPSVIEGIPTTRSVLALAGRSGVEMPIVAAVASVLFDGHRPQDAIQSLMTRRLHAE
ncbi:MAG: NAD(P)H-dependent glycerol-3-phosphate dehydrogenase [Phycisphaerae bacterium]